MYIQSVVDSEEKSLQDFALFKSAPDQNTVINSLCKLCHWPTHTDRFSLKFAFTGAEAYYVRHRKLTVERNRLLVVNAGQPYAGTVQSVEWVQCLAIYFAPALLEAAASNLSDEQLLTNPFDQTGAAVWFYEQLLAAPPTLQRRLRQLKQKLESGPLSDMALEEQLHAILLELLATHHRQVGAAAGLLSAVKPTTRLEIYRRLHLARKFIEAEATEALSLASIAQVSMLSRNHLLRHFRQLFGHSPHQYLTAVRLEKAKTLLMQSELPVREVGGATGFESPSSFGRLFKSVFALTPQQFRLQHVC